MKMVYIEKDDQVAIALCKDNYKGVSIQVIRMVDQIVPTGVKNELTNVRSNQVIHQEIVHIKKGCDFKQEVDQAIATAKEIVAEMRAKDATIDGLMNNFFSQNKALNEVGEQK